MVDKNAPLGSGSSENRISSPSQPAGSKSGTGDAGSEKNLKLAEENKDKTDQQVRDEKARSEEVTDKETGIITRTVEDKEGNKTIISSVTSEDADKHLTKARATPVFENLTQSLLGTTGNTNLTEDGILAGDKSLRDERELDEINEEIEAKAGPNPLPNREGNEMLKAANFGSSPLGVNTLRGLDRKTNTIAGELREMSKNKNFSKDEKAKLESMATQLSEMGKVPA